MGMLAAVAKAGMSTRTSEEVVVAGGAG